jgi:alkylation response protein AidB-like acyl-CoA dehydrogenase
MVSAAVHPENPSAEAKPEVINFLVKRDCPGLRIEPTWNSLAMNLSGSHDLVLDNVEADEDSYIGNTRASATIAARQLFWNLPVCALYYGVGRAAAKYATNFARNRKPNSLDKPVSELTHIQEKAGQMELALLSAESVLFATAALHTNPEMSSAEITGRVSASKYLATNKAIEATDLAMRIVGAAALAMTSPMQRYYRDVRAGLNNPPQDDAALTNVGKWSLDIL